jgi:hypothetical protein
MMKVPRDTTMGSNVAAVPAASDFSSHCPAEIKDKISHSHIFNTCTLQYNIHIAPNS